MNLIPDRKNPAGWVLLFALLMLVIPVTAMVNPAAGYCTALGYTYSIQQDTQGNDVGYCTFPDGRSLYAWQFLLGKTGQDYSYCARAGYASRVVNDSAACEQFLQPTCLACVFPNGSAMEVTQVMGLDFREKVCTPDTCRNPGDYPLPRYLIPPPPTGGGQSLPAWAVPAGVLVVIIIIAGIIAGNKRKGKTS